VLASMGNYVFDTRALAEAVTADAADASSSHDIGRNIIPMLAEQGRAQVWDFAASAVPGVAERERGYWRDVGTLDAYFEAHVDLISVEPVFSLYNDAWPILTFPGALPPAKFVFAEPERAGVAYDSIVCPGVIVSGGSVHRSILSPGVRVHSYSTVEDAVLLHGVDVGRGAAVRRAIVDKNVRIAPGVRIGFDEKADRARFTVSDAGVVVIPKGARVEA